MKILLAVDGSEQSHDAARALAHLTPAEETIVVHAVDVPAPAYPMMMPEVAQDLSATLERTMREQGQRLLERMASVVPGDIGPVRARLEMGRPVDVVLGAAEAEGAELIVLGARGLTPMKELLLGSVSQRVAGQAHGATLVVKAPVPALRRVLVAVEGPSDGTQVVRLLARKPFRTLPDVTILTVLPMAQPLWPVGLSDAEALKEKAMQSARAFVDDQAAHLARSGYRATGAVTLGLPATAILGWAKETQADLIVVGTRGRRGVERLLLGSVSHAVLAGAACPVLVVR